MAESTEIERVHNEVERTHGSARGRALAERLVTSVVARMGVTATASAVFGEPVCNGDVTVVPVARVAHMAGGGGGGADRSDGVSGEDGAGTGGAAFGTPAGFIEITPEGAVFRPVRRPAKSLVVPLAVITAWAAVKIVRASVRR